MRRLRRRRDDADGPRQQPGGELPSLLRESAGGRFLLGAVVPGDRWSGGPDDRESVEAQVDRDSAWEGTWEWRTGRQGSDRIERLAEGRYRASCDYHGSASVEVPDLESAFEAICVLGAVQRTLLDAIDWGSWPDDRRRRATTPGDRYLRLLAREARKSARALGPQVKRALSTPEGWNGDPPGRRTIRAVTIAGRSAFHVEVAEDSLVFATYAASLDRALAFMGAYAGLERDLRRILGWEPLAA